MKLDAVVVGSGPNGLAAAITLARAGLRVRLYEAAATIGGGARTKQLTLPGFWHDTCSAVHPLGVGSPILRSLPLEKYGLRWVFPKIQLAQTLADGSAAILSRDIAETTATLGIDGNRYRKLVGPYLGRWDELAADLLHHPGVRRPSSPGLLTRFGISGAPPVALLLRLLRGEPARSLLAGLAAHVLAPLSSPLTSGVALMFALSGHETGWPIARHGSQSISDALAAYFKDQGGQIQTGRLIRRFDELPDARFYLFNVSPSALAAIAPAELPSRWTDQLKSYRYGPAAFKVDYALSAPVPWLSAECRQAGTVHVAASAREIGTSLAMANSGTAPEAPFLITCQPSLFDQSRAPAGQHTFWVYAHVPNGWTGDLVDRIEAQIERFAPGFKQLVLARAVTSPAALFDANPNCVGGNIAGGRCNSVHGILRPRVFARVPYATPNPRIFLCSSSTTPGPGVHGMCGYQAAVTALRSEGRRVPGL